MSEHVKNEELKLCQCRQKPRLCFTGKVYKVICDTEDCHRYSYGKTKEIAISKWNGIWNLITEKQ